MSTPETKYATVSFTTIVCIEGGRLVGEGRGLDLFDLRQQLQTATASSTDRKHGHGSDAEETFAKSLDQ